MADEWSEAGSTSRSVDEYARLVSKMAVANVLGRGAGFEMVQADATSALVDVMATYIRRIGKQAQDLAEVAGRTKPQATDVLLALEDMVPAPVVFSDLVQTFKDAHQKYEGRLAFPRDLPRFPSKKLKRKHADVVDDIGRRETEQPSYAPAFAPPLPHRHTYSQERYIVVEKEHDPKRIRLDQLRQKSEVQESLHNLVDNVVPPPVSSFPATVAEPIWKPHLGRHDSHSTSNAFLRQPSSAKHATTNTDLYETPKVPFRPVVAKPVRKNVEHVVVNETLRVQANKEDMILAGTYHDGDSD
ncbi:hypothetical protein SPRG_02021 [Saprolegnia parasitica CBS 223.65]|uniref:Transcription initiation factor TFIID subunit 8 n=1 Tax=Saprolegnia parasitica (strain CBS 223.65) TaxID=695850 RepID=A0A067CRB2_SAPPC|nr:hypothetical protein SPRG_02021 [Saprolegnia parasitica CBS 223.65]KDO33209.1 hypothetical protein SPRG_02021 [Saprolegnia parasitica CBS 223.65]|eukprot:XP_012195968.1 hypothetical protein SPRG_02021 [Saprolegnia parasitica CBS 223.65]